MTALITRLRAATIIANRHPLHAPSHDLPRSKADVRVLAEWDRAVCAWAVVEVLQEKVRADVRDGEGRRT